MYAVREKQSSDAKDKSVKSHRRYKSCDVKALIASANRTTSVDEGYSASTKSDASSDSQSPEISSLPDQADIPPSTKTNTNLHSTVENSFKNVTIQTAAQQSNSQNSAGHVAEYLQKTGVLASERSKTDVIKQASSLNQDLSKLNVSKAQEQGVAGSVGKVKDLPMVRKPAKLQTKAALPLLDIATMSKDRAYTF